MRKPACLTIATVLTAASLLSACTNEPVPRAAPSSTESTGSTGSTGSTVSTTTTPAPTTSTSAAAAETSSPAPAPPGAPTTRPAPAPSRTFGPDGFGAVRLGMSERQALDTGEVTRNPSGHRFTAYPVPDDRSPICVSPALGVAAMFAQPGMRTPQGIGLGSGMDQFERAYPGAWGGPNGRRVPVPGNPRAIYVAVSDEGGRVVASLALALNDHGCFG